MTSQHDKPKRWQFGMKGMLIAVSIAATTLAAGVALYPVFDGHPVTMHRLARVKTGMTKSDVVRILGEPSVRQSNDWRYSGMTWCFVVVTFDKDERVVLVEHDH